MKEKYEAIVEENKKLKTKVNVLSKFMLKNNFTFKDYKIRISLKRRVGEGGGDIISINCKTALIPIERTTDKL